MEATHVQDRPTVDGTAEAAVSGQERGGGARRAVLALIGAYQAVSAARGRSYCRYVPTCSEYTRQAVFSFGVLRGAWLGLRRISRCHPWHEAGYDPVPEEAVSAKRRLHPLENGITGKGA
jgi:putative membrane protein insertion efficiency factor